MAVKLTEEEALYRIEINNPTITVLDKYKGVDSKILIRDELDCFYNYSPYSLMKGCRPYMSASVDKTYNFIQKANHANKHIFFFNESRYTDWSTNLLVKDSDGITHGMLPSSILRGNKPSFVSAVDKNEYFKFKAIKQHGNKYNYDNIKYVNRDSILEIICPRHGSFLQRACNHLNHRGCSLCKSEDAVGGWTRRNWIERSMKSNDFDGFKVYIIRCYNNNNNESFYKIGRTFTKLKRRFKCSSVMPYKWVVIGTIESSDPNYIYDTETRLHRVNKKNKYTPLIKFNGDTECFNKVNYS